jgi:hypothetical protein
MSFQDVLSKIKSATTIEEVEAAMAKKRITKQCKTLKQAERHQNKLYEQYNSVVLVSFPRSIEEGEYVWEVAWV